VFQQTVSFLLVEEITVWMIDWLIVFPLGL